MAKTNGAAGANGAASANGGEKTGSCPITAEQLFIASTSLSAFFAANLNQNELLTLSNLLVMLQANISTIVTQQQLCEGEPVQPL